MKPLLALIAGAFCIAGSPPMIESATYSNEEQVYFDKEAKREAPPWTSIRIDAGKILAVDAYGMPVSGAITANQLRRIASDKIELRFADGKVSELRRARSVSCWVAVRKEKPKADGSEDWYFQSGVKLHDQGGRARVGGGESGAQPIIIRLRNVTWDTGSTNAPVVTLYAHKADSPERAEAYSWAAPDSSRVGINLRWMQAGCTIGPAAPSALKQGNFRG
jgi:hypothetical protein